MPFTWGNFSPRLLLPQEASGWSRERSRAVLLHETAHIKRLDYLTQFISQVVCMLYWFNPVVWIAVRQMAAECESASDDMVLSCGLKGSDYAEQLLSISAGLASNTGRAFAAVGMARKSLIEGRILSVLDTGRNRAVLSKSLLLTEIVVLCCVSVPVAMLETTVQGKEQKQENGIAKQKANSELPKGKARLLRFPADKAVGIVYTRPRRADGYGIFHTFNTFNTFNNWKRIGFARGDVRVPANADVRLDITRDSSLNLSFLDKLSPDAIQRILLTNTRVDNSGLEYIGRLTGLKYLDLTYTKITDRGIQHLESLTNLEHISLDGLRVKEKEFTVGDDGLAVLSKLPALKQLDLMRSNVTNKGLAHLVGNKSLLLLSLWGNNITNEGLVHLKDLSGLEYLKLGGDGRKKSEINDKGLQHLASLTNLKFLQWNHMEITDEGLKHLRNFPRLESLVLEDTNVTNAGMIHLLPLKSLKNFRLYGLGLKDEGMKHLSKVQSLENITANLYITNEGLGHLSKLTKLKSVNLVSEDISDLGMQHIAKMKSLKTLWFQSCSITDAGLA